MTKGYVRNLGGTSVIRDWPDSPVGNADLANMAAATIKGRALGAGTGAPTDLTASQAISLITAGHADASYVTGNCWGTLPFIGSDGVMEVGRYIDFHNSDADASDYAIRLDTGGGTTDLYIGPAAGGANKIATVSSTTWTPGISFGGGTTGITYTTQVGRYTKIGNLVWLQGLIVLSSKGSSTGNARITGLPVASSSVANNFSGMGLLHNSMSSAGPFYNYAGASSSVLEVLKASVNTTIVADQTDFSNTTALTIGFMYMTD